MADKSLTATKNVAGKYYVDTNCVSCGQCAEIAVNFFVQNQEGGYYVKAQPQTAEELVLCEQALSNCPIEAIGNDGE